MVAEQAANTTSMPENGRSFYGRQDVFAWVQQCLAKQSPTQPIVLTGPPRIGKTAVLNWPEHVMCELQILLSFPGSATIDMHYCAYF